MERESLKPKDLFVVFILILEENMSEEVKIIRNARAWIITKIAAFVNMSVQGAIWVFFFSFLLNALAVLQIHNEEKKSRLF